ncbi:MAG: pentapeptide repeat-containing protein [Micrococcales bacterium]|nr:pentapeptide repeat-containing protein [Micrococcales bacterium]OJX66722.1 MAG: hypothetical protein BGO94_07725 [Micrococcales bacterium 72-143]
MPAQKPLVAPPRLDPVRLPELEPGDDTRLEPSATLEGLAFEGVVADAVELGGARLESCRIAGLRAAEADLRGTTVRETLFEHLDIPVVRGARTRWREVSFEGGRLGSAELYDAEWQSVQFTGAKLGFLNLRGARLEDVRFTDCVIDELDLGSAAVERLALPGVRIRHLDVTRATLRDVDLRGCAFEVLTGAGFLRGAVIDTDQLALLAPVLASELGLTVAD